MIRSRKNTFRRLTRRERRQVDAQLRFPSGIGSFSIRVRYAPYERQWLALVPETADQPRMIYCLASSKPEARRRCWENLAEAVSLGYCVVRP